MPVKTLIPKNDAAEQAVIGSLLMGASPYAAPIRAEHFAAPDHRLVFGAVMALADEGQPANVTSVTSYLTAKGQLEDAGGPPARFLSADVASGGESTVQHYFADLEAARRNREAVLHIHKHLDDLTSLRVDAVQFAEELAQLSAPAAVSSGGDSVADILREMEQTSGEDEMFPSGLAPLDKHLGGGFLRGELAVVAGGTGSGKSALLVQAAVANAAAGRRVIYYTLELGKTELTLRGASIYRNVPLPRKTRPPFTAAMNSALCDLGTLPLHFRQDCGDQLPDILANIRAEARAGRCDMVIVDYLQLVGNKSETRELEVAGTSRALKAVAMREQIAMLTASQLNDGGLLRESRAIGHDADFVMLIKDENIVVDKCRRGPRGVAIACHLQGAHSRFVATAREQGR
jgi:replicative DNA helicase